MRRSTFYLSHSLLEYHILTFIYRNVYVVHSHHFKYGFKNAFTPRFFLFVSFSFVGTRSTCVCVCICVNVLCASFSLSSGNWNLTVTCMLHAFREKKNQMKKFFEMRQQSNWTEPLDRITKWNVIKSFNSISFSWALFVSAQIQFNWDVNWPLVSLYCL